MPADKVLSLDEHRSRILNETKNVSSFVIIGETLERLYHKDKLVKNQKEFLEWTKKNLGFSKSTTYEYIISYRVYNDIASTLPPNYRPPMYQSHCQLLSKIPKEQLSETWMAVCDTAPDSGITTAFLERFLEERNLRTVGTSRSSSGRKSRASTGTNARRISGGSTASTTTGGPSSIPAGSATKKRGSASVRGGKRGGRKSVAGRKRRRASYDSDDQDTESSSSASDDEFDEIEASPAPSSSALSRQASIPAVRSSSSAAAFDMHIDPSEPSRGLRVPSRLPRTRTDTEDWEESLDDEELALRQQQMNGDDDEMTSEGESDAENRDPHATPRVGDKSDSLSYPPTFPRHSFGQKGFDSGVSAHQTPSTSPYATNSSANGPRKKYTFLTPPSTVHANGSISSRGLPSNLLQSPVNSEAATRTAAEIIGRTPPKKRSKVMSGFRQAQMVPEVVHFEEPPVDDSHRMNLLTRSSPHASPLTSADVMSGLLRSSSQPIIPTASIRSSFSAVSPPCGAHTHTPSHATFNEALIFQLGQTVVLGQQFDLIAHTTQEFQMIDQDPWFGRVWCNLSGFRPFSTALFYRSPPVPDSVALERSLQIVFTKFANKEFTEGLFLLRAEFGADWFTPILQHPYCILRHIHPPEDASIQSRNAVAAGNVAGGDQSDNRPLFESFVVFYLGPNIKEFCASFRSVGVIPGVNSWSAVMTISTVIPEMSLVRMDGMNSADPVDEAALAAAVGLHPVQQTAISSMTSVSNVHSPYDPTSMIRSASSSSSTISVTPAPTTETASMDIHSAVDEMSCIKSTDFNFDIPMQPPLVEVSSGSVHAHLCMETTSADSLTAKILQSPVMVSPAFDASAIPMVSSASPRVDSAALKSPVITAL